MAHKPMVGGTVYEIAKGKDLAGGTVYEKDHGKTLVNGTVYEVGFAQPMVILTMKYNVGNEKHHYIVIDGVQYGQWGSQPATIEVPVGTVVDCYVCTDSYDKESAYVSVNGTKVFITSSSGTYKYTVVGNATVNLDGRWDSEKEGCAGFIIITEQ